jgi:hypothetical protein
MALINSGDLFATSYQTKHTTFDGDALDYWWIRRRL